MTWTPEATRQGPESVPGGRRRTFRVVVDGVPYVVEVEELAGSPAPAATMPARAPIDGAIPVRPALRPHVAPPQPAAAPLGGSADGPIGAPMPGVVVAVAVEPGQRVTKGDVLVVLSAMKLENEVRSPRDGIVGAVHVQIGETVMAGRALVSLSGERDERAILRGAPAAGINGIDGRGGEATNADPRIGP